MDQAARQNQSVLRQRAFVRKRPLEKFRGKDRRYSRFAALPSEKDAEDYIFAAFFRNAAITPSVTSRVVFRPPKSGVRGPSFTSTVSMARSTAEAAAPN